MKSNFLIILLIAFLSILSSNGFAQSTKLDSKPEPEAGINRFREYISANYQYPREAQQAKVKGIVKISFVVKKTGELSDIKVLEDPGFGTAEELIRVVEASKNELKWKPGIKDGKPVNVRYALPLNLKTVLKNNRGY